jgi:hypothetical protein
MAASLQQILLAPDTQPKVIADCYTLIEQELSDKSGVSGTAVKFAYKTVNTFIPGHIRYMVESLLPQMVDGRCLSCSPGTRSRLIRRWSPVADESGFQRNCPGVLSGRAAGDLVGPQLAADADRGRRLAAAALGR